MKVYLFHTENGLYEGETFEDAAMIQHEDGLTPIPPPIYEPGQVPVFDKQKNAWAIIPVTIARQLLNISRAESLEKTS